MSHLAFTITLEVILCHIQQPVCQVDSFDFVLW